ncbi:hypothetical protein BT69DRAFT_1219210 [Atractiella rhizophila]|nr:hypothetical protein BT69DRAFT_1219210 [Atractiella rhizophila]
MVCVPFAGIGTGKSLLLREIIFNLKKKHGDKVAITGTTGMAACNVGGITIHSFAGIGLGEGNASFLLGQVRKNRKASSRWLRSKVLIIDEGATSFPCLYPVDGLVCDFDISFHA